MSMLDSFLNKGFKASKCKTLLKLTIPRIKLLRNRKEFQLKQMRRDIAKLLETGQEATARIRVEHIIREVNMLAAQEIIELFCELVSVRLPIIESQRECPLDLKEAISSICFAAPRCADLPELQQVQLAFVSKYGKEFVASASALMPDCGVNRQLIELLSVRAPSPERKLKLLKDIAEEHELNWDPAPSETELFKSHEDLLNGPSEFISGSKAPLPKENDEILQSTLVHAESEEDFDDEELEFPEVPKGPLRPSERGDTDTDPSSETAVESVEKSCSQSIKGTLRPSGREDTDPSSETAAESVEKSCSQSINNLEDMSQAAAHESPKPSENTGISKQFVPFISLQTMPPMPLPSAPVRDSYTTTQPPNPVRPKRVANVDLNDVLAAAKAAAESADRAAVAARAAASLVELRISELIQSRSAHSVDMNEVENPFHASDADPSAEIGKLNVGDNPWSPLDHFQNNQIENGSKDDLDDFSYPNLFGSQSPENSLPRQGSDLK